MVNKCSSRFEKYQSHLDKPSPINMKRSRSDAFGDEVQPSKLQRVNNQSCVSQSYISPTQRNQVEDVDLRRVMDEFVVIYEGLDTTDDPLVKPNYSYTELVYLALVRSPNFCLPINEIYKYIQLKFQFFRRNTREHWRNAVRHSLSKTKCFTKIGVRRGPNSKGTYNRSMFLWTFNPSSIVNFARGDYRPSVDEESGTNTLRWGYYRINAGFFWDRVSVSMESKMTSFKNALISSPVQAEIFEQQTCILPTLEDQTTTSSPPTPDISHPIVSPTGPSHVTFPYPSNSPDADAALSPGSYYQLPVNYSSPLYSYSAYPAWSPCKYNRLVSQDGYPDASQGQDSPHLTQSTSTPVQSTPDIAAYHNTPATSPVTWESPDNSRTYNTARDTPRCDSVYAQSWSSFHDSGLYSDYFSPDNSYTKSFNDGRQFHSPPQNVNMFSPSFSSQTFQYRRNIRKNSKTLDHHQVIVVNQQMFPKLPSAFTFDSVCDPSQDSCVVTPTGSELCTNSNWLQSSCDSQTDSASPTYAQDTQNSISVLSGDELSKFDFLQGFDSNMFSSVDNLSSHSQ